VGNGGDGEVVLLPALLIEQGILMRFFRINTLIRDAIVCYRLSMKHLAVK